MKENFNEDKKEPETAAYDRFRAALGEEAGLFKELKRFDRIGPLPRIEDRRMLKDINTRLDAAQAARREAYDAWVNSFRDLDAA